MLSAKYFILKKHLNFLNPFPIAFLMLLWYNKSCHYNENGVSYADYI